MPIDIITLLVLALGFWHGFTRGIISTLFNIFAYLFGFILAFKMTPVATTVLERIFNTENPLMPIAGFMLNLSVVFIIMRAAAGSIESILSFAYMGIVNRVLGGVVTGIFYVLMFSVLLWFFVKATIVSQETTADSRLYPILEEMPLRAKDAVVRFKPLATDLWNDSIDWMDKIEQYGVEKTEEPGSFYKPEYGNDGIEDLPED